ncbi:hypothetical protein CFAEC_09630 [Corynebacterium faecale]|uniref:hypothetical protein n=1 Tax=Corynebacterium faecale TaxID=1758466 RepID=UPI0025B41C0E|nr:hypothetical protein [Corynebacterium faecale]WJY92743.1 hypothetical protein CFAEC_09630 [Corynebacterium faecale]
MAHIDMWDIFRDVPQEALAGHFRRYLENHPEQELLGGKSDSELAELLVVASTGAADDRAVTQIFDYAMKFLRFEEAHQ